MYSIEEVYEIFRRSQSRYYNRPYRIPKDINKTFSKMIKRNYQCLEKFTNMLNTCYHNIDPERYFDYGFQLYKDRFSYVKFLDDKVLKIYIIKDKNVKREATLSKKAIIKSLKFVIKWMSDKRNKKISLLSQYTLMYDENTLAPIRHYNMNKIDKYFFVWLIRDKYLLISDDLKNEIPIIIDNFRNLSYDLETINDFLDEVKEKIKEM